MPTTIDGLVTGIDTSKLIDGLLAVGRRRIELLTQDQQKISTRQTAFKGIEARLLALQTEVSRLGRSQNSVFDARKVSSSSEDLVKGAASSSAVGGTYTLKVNSLARAHVVASQGFDDPNSTIT